MTSLVRKTYDTDIITIRNFFLRNPLNNSPISSGYLMVASDNGIGYINPSSLSTTVTSQAGLSTLSTLISNNFLITQKAVSTLSTAIGTGGGGGTGDVTKANLISTVDGLGQIYLSSLTGLQISTGLVQTSTVNFIDTGDTTFQVMEVKNGTLQINGAPITGGGGVTAAQLTSSLKGLGTLQYISTSFFNFNVISTVQGLGTAGYISSASGGANQDVITSSIKGLGTVGYLSTISFSNVISTSFYDSNTTSTVAGLGTANYLSSAQLYSTVKGLGTVGYLSTVSFSNVISTSFYDTNTLSTVKGLGTVGYLSTISFSNVISTSFFDENTISTVKGLGNAGYISTSFYQANTISTVKGLGSVGYLSSLSSLGISSGTLTTNKINFIDQGTTPNLLNLRVIDNALYFNGSPVGSGNVFNTYNTSSYIYQVSTSSTIFIQAGATAFISQALNVLLYPDGYSSIYFSTGQVTTSSIRFIDTQTNLLQLLAVKNGNLQLNGNAITGDFTQVNANSTISGLGTAGYYSTLSELSTVRGLGTAGYISTLSLFSSLAGLGTAGYYSTMSELSTVKGLGTLGYLSSISFSNVISTSFFDTNITSSIQGLGTAGYYSTLSELSTVRGLGTLGYLSTVSFSNVISTSFYDTNTLSTVKGLGTVGYLSTISFSNVISTSFYDTNTLSTVQGLGTANYLSSAQLYSTVKGLGTVGYLSTVSFSNVISTSFYDTNTLSTVRGLGTAGYLSTVSFSNVISTSFYDTNTLSTVKGLGTAGFISSFFLTQMLVTSTIQGLGTYAYLSSVSFNNFISTPFYDANTLSTVKGLGTAGYISSSFYDTNSLSTVRGLGTAGYLSTTLSSFYLSSLYTNQVQTSSIWIANRSGGPFTGGSAQDTSYQLLVSDANLYYRPTLLPLPASFSGTLVINQLYLTSNINSTLTGLGTLGYLSSSAGVSQAGITSTVTGLGTAGYLSTISLLSTVAQIQTITNSTIGGWAFTPAAGDVLLNNNNTTTKLKSVTPNYGIILETNAVLIKDANSAYTNLQLNTIDFKTSSSAESYSLGFNPLGTGTVSSFVIARTNGGTNTAGLYISSLFLGGFGGTTYGQIRTDPTATNLYWNNSQLNNQSGGGGGNVSFTFISTNSLSSIFVSSSQTFFNLNSTKTTTADVLNFSSLFINNTPIIVDSNGNLLVTSQTI